MTLYDAACIALAFMLALYLLEWLGVMGARFADAIGRAHRRGLERVAWYDAACRRRELARAVDRHPAGFLPR